MQWNYSMARWVIVGLGWTWEQWLQGRGGIGENFWNICGIGMRLVINYAGMGGDGDHCVTPSRPLVGSHQLRCPEYTHWVGLLVPHHRWTRPAFWCQLPAKFHVCISNSCSAVVLTRFCWLSGTNRHTNTCQNTCNHLYGGPHYQVMSQESLLVCWHKHTDPWIQCQP